MSIGLCALRVSILRLLKITPLDGTIPRVMPEPWSDGLGSGADVSKPTVEEIRTSLPDWPDDVISLWLAPLAQRSDTGWPPPSPIVRSAWRHILAGHDLEWWKPVRWVLQEEPIAQESLSARDQATASKMYRAYFADEFNEFVMIPTGRDRVLRAAEYTLAHGTWPQPPVALRAADGLQLVDGHHRLVALLMCSNLSPQDSAARRGASLAPAHRIWIGAHPTSSGL